MDSEIKRTYKVQDDEVFEFEQKDHNYDALIRSLDEVSSRPRPQTVENRERERQIRRNLEQEEIFLRDRQESAMRKRENIAAKSVGTQRRTNQKYRKRNSNIIIARKQKQVASILCAIAIATGLTLTGIKTVETVNNFVQTQVNIKNGNAILKAEAINKLCLNNLATINDKGKCIVNENTVSDYKKLNISSHLDVYIFSEILPSSEFNKFIKAVSYNNGYNYYIDMNQFLVINGYYIKGTNAPSIDVFNNMMENRINDMAYSLNEYTVDNNTFEVEESHKRGGL